MADEPNAGTAGWVPSEEDFQLAEKLVNHQWGTSVSRLAAAFRDVRGAAYRRGIEAGEQIALAYRDEVDAGHHPDVSDPAHSLGQGYAANVIAKRVRALAPPQERHLTGREQAVMKRALRRSTKPAPPHRPHDYDGPVCKICGVRYDRMAARTWCPGASPQEESS
jgi:hypothetical protein